MTRGLPDLPEATLSAVRSGDLAQLKKLFSDMSFDKITEKDMFVDSIAHEAASSGQPDILEWCYPQGWYPAPKSYNATFFVAATSGASPSIFQILINHGWDLNGHENEACGDALSSAIIGGQYEFAKWLLENGHRTTPVDGWHGESSITWAVSGDNASIDMLKLLLKHGCDMKGSGAGLAAAEEGNIEALRLLLDAGIDTEERTTRTWFTRDDDEEEEEEEEEKEKEADKDENADEDEELEYDEPKDTKVTALYRACRQGQLECVKLLVERGADIQAKDDAGTSCLEVAKRHGRADVVKYLEGVLKE